MSENRRNLSTLVMTPKRHKRLDPIRKTTNNTFSVVPRNKPKSPVQCRSSLHKSIGFVIILAQCFALMPVKGVTSRDISYIKFKWISLRMLYSIFAIFGSLTSVTLYIMQFVNNEKEFSDIVNIIFFTTAALCTSLFITIARNWFKLNEQWLSVEYYMRNYPSHPNLKRRFLVTTCIIMVLSLGEHILSVAKNISRSAGCSVSKTNTAKAYFGYAFSHVFAIVGFSGWIAFFMEFFIILATFTWNFSDLFIILMCAALAERFKQLNKQIKTSEIKNEIFWKQIREDYTRLSTLCKVLDSTICHLVTIAFGNNLFFICVQLFHTLKPFHGAIDTIYFVCSFGFLLGRTAALSVYCCWINDESKNTLVYLFDITSQDYGIEASRLTQQIAFYPVVITGSNYFSVTRGLCLQVAGAVITFELILFQIGPMFVKTDDSDKIVCVD